MIMRDRPVGFTLAWLTVILIFPLGGAMLYLMFGELRWASAPRRFGRPAFMDHIASGWPI